jgi:sugar/nucleoside kinase (ribokinase family)
VAKLDFVSIGEVMIQLNSITPGPLRYARYFEVHVAGSEANIMVGLSKLGYRTGLITRIGRDEFGEMILRTLRGEGIDTTHVKFMDNVPTGIYFVQRHYPIPGKSTVFYYRHLSAASYMDEGDVDEEYIGSSRALFLTGITPALSDSCYRAFRKAIDAARSRDIDIILDTNIRMKLWKTPERAREALLPVLRDTRILITNKEDLAVLYPEAMDSKKQLINKLLNLGIEMIVIKKGEEGSELHTRDGKEVFEKAIEIPIIEDVIGAGDAFDAALLASLYRGIEPSQALRYANIAGALVVTVRGDIEAQPTWDVLETLSRYMREKMEYIR